MCDRRPKPFWFRRQRQKGALHLQQVAPVHFQTSMTSETAAPPAAVDLGVVTWRSHLQLNC